MALYTKESRDRVRDAVDFVELVSARTELRRAGAARYEGLCPFHEERTPSFGIDPVQKVFYCFGCQASGDVFTFVQETEGVDFKAALELLADRYGVELEREAEDPREADRRRRRERLLELLGRTAAYYERYLWESPQAGRAREYLDGRGLGEEMLREFRVGYAPSAWDRVLLASRRSGFSADELYATGLAQRSRENGQPYDRFRSRIMFPLADVRGRVLGFGARALEDEQDAPEDAAGGGRRGRPKYLNTSDNDVYHKGLHLYGGHLARPHAARAGVVIVCEGYTDTIALHQAGMRNAVGLMGTALTAEQVGELARMAQTVLLALDSDTAGQEAMLRAWTLAQQRRLELRVVVLPEGADPAELLREQGPEAMRSAIDSAVPFVRFRVERALAGGENATPEGRDRTLEDLRPVFATLPPSATRMELTRLVSSRLELPESVAEQLLAPDQGGGGRRAGGDARAGGPRAEGAGAEGLRGGGARRAPGQDVTAGGREAAGARVLTRAEQTERTLLALCVALPVEGARVLRELDLDEHFSNELVRSAARHLRDGDLAEPMAEREGDQALDEQPQLGRLLAEIVVEAGRSEARTAMLEAQSLQLELARIERRILRARGAGRGEVGDLARRRGEVKRELDTAVGRVLQETAAREG